MTIILTIFRVVSFIFFVFFIVLSYAAQLIDDSIIVDDFQLDKHIVVRLFVSDCVKETIFRASNDI